MEVKGPGDRLSQKQILWMDFFLSQGVDAEVCHVTGMLPWKLSNSPTALAKSVVSWDLAVVVVRVAK